MEKPLGTSSAQVITQVLFLILLMIVSLFVGLTGAFAQSERKTPAGFVQKTVVFPIDTPKVFQKAADEAWWTIREEMTDTKRLMVAAKRFMIQKDVFQPRKDLSPPDVILLSQLLDSDTLITSQLVGRELKMSAYDHFDGGLLWEQSLTLHPSIPIDQQLKGSAQTLIRDFIAALPGQGHVILDPLINQAVYEEGDLKISKQDVGANSRVADKDPIQWIQLERTGNGPLFGSGGRVTVVADGEILKSENGILTAEIKRVKEISQIRTLTLIRLPKEVDFLHEQFALKNEKALKPELRYNPMPPATEQDDKGKPLFAALAAIGSVVALLLLAL